MRNLLNFLAKYNNLIIFIFLEGLALYLIASGNNYHNSKLGNVLRSTTRGMESRISEARVYINLVEVNKRLAAENVVLRNRIDRLLISGADSVTSVYDTLYNQYYTYTPAEVVRSSVNRQKNFFTLNKGTAYGIKTDMAVTSMGGVAGVIVGATANYSVAMSVLNTDFRLSARIKSSGYFGSLSWDGRDYRYAILNEIPQHVYIMKGDTIEATGFSTLFPEGTVVGTISDYEKPGGDFYRIKVLLNADFKKLHYVEVIGSLRKNEILQLEKQYPW